MTVFGPRHKAIVIPSATVERVAAQLAERGRITRGYLGVGLQPVAVAGQTTPCVMVISIDANGPAALAGLHQGDIIVTLDDAALTHARHLNARLGPETVGKVLKVGLLRAGVPLDLSVTIGERPAA